MSTDNGILTESQVEKISENFTKSTNNLLKSWTLKPLSDQHDGLVGEQYKLSIEYEDANNNTNHTVQFFVKTLNGANKIMFDISKSIKAHEKEAFYYEELSKKFELFGLDISFMPNCYFSEPYVVVLDDLTQSSYKGTFKRDPLDLEHCKNGLQVIAKFHSTSLIYEEKLGQNLGRKYRLTDDYKEILEDQVFTKEDNGATKWLKYTIKGLSNLIDLIPENGVSKHDFKKRFAEFLDGLLGSSPEELHDFRCTILHGDLWSNNFMFKYDNNGKIIDTKLIDFQIIKYGVPALDVLQFIMTNTRKNFREQYLNELLDYYYDCLSGLLSRQNLVVTNIIGKNEFKKSCEVFLLPAKLQAVADRSITFMADQVWAEAAQSDEIFENFLFADRGKYISDSFNDNRLYRDLMTEDMEELRSMLFSDN